MQIRDYPEIELTRISCYFTFGTIFGTRKLFSKKYTHAEVVIIQPLPHAIYTKFLPKFSNLRHKTSSRRRFLQHYYRDASKKPQKAHRYPRDVLILFYACADSSKWGLFGRCARSAFRRTPSGREKDPT